MANNFSSDPNCIALWKLENNADDSKGGNDLAEVNSPAYDDTDRKEGTHCIDLERDNSQYCTIADGDLDFGFPGKSGTGEPSFSICFRVKRETLIPNVGMVSKYVQGSGYRTFVVRGGSSGELDFLIGWNGGVSYTALLFDSYLESGKWYHVGVAYDASDNGMKIRVWDDNAGALLDDNKEGTAGGDMYFSAAQFEIGRYGASDSYIFDGKLDEVAIFNKVLTDAEIDAIRAGTYSGGATEKSSADTGSGVDACVSLETGAAKTASDSGAGVDAVESLQTPQAKTSSDVGSGAEGAPIASAALAGGESGSGLEALIARLLTGGESGGAVEDSEVVDEGTLKDLFAGEAAEGIDSLVARIEMPVKGGGMKLWT
ncbi:MAG TPA: LamG domain-containing protein [Dehalococcoidales bacterium]|nr:LamG domain-containing protein [Dehalococcoidales bacterium]